jgi:hypothetical protein
MFLKGVNMQCNYCGSNSGKTDRRGHCLSCGAPYTSAYLEQNFVESLEYDCHKGHCILIPTSLSAQNNSTYVRSFICNSKDLDNGSIVQSSYKIVPNSGGAYEILDDKTSLHNLWLIYSPEYSVFGGGLNTDPRKFYNIKGMVMAGVKLFPNDAITVPDYNILGEPAEYITVSEGNERLHWCKQIYDDRLMFAKTETTRILFQTDSRSIETTRVMASRIEVIHN